HRLHSGSFLLLSFLSAPSCSSSAVTLLQNGSLQKIKDHHPLYCSNESPRRFSLISDLTSDAPSPQRAARRTASWRTSRTTARIRRRSSYLLCSFSAAGGEKDGELADVSDNCKNSKKIILLIVSQSSLWPRK
ncbi:hypothetical protein PRIPAC_89455, partial [Pristionchus pacificus]|uniref:Uncharacterized protein n=1 Tax=Pristionchus pacificus TaxID=54126 RepID=A0A2A6B929_PRIPA